MLQCQFRLDLFSWCNIYALDYRKQFFYDLAFRYTTFLDSAIFRPGILPVARVGDAGTFPHNFFLVWWVSGDRKPCSEDDWQMLSGNPVSIPPESPCSIIITEWGWMVCTAVGGQSFKEGCLWLFELWREWPSNDQNQVMHWNALTATVLHSCFCPILCGKTLL